MNRSLIIKFSIIVLIGIFGASLLFILGNDPEREITGIDGYLMLAGFFIFFGAICAFVILLGRQRKPMTNEASRNWEHERLKGKRAFVIDFVAKIAVPLFIVMSLFTLSDYLAGKPPLESLKIFGMLFVVLTGGAFLAAHEYWKYLEHEFALKNSEKKPD